jgi:hypothetical protein
MTDFLTDNEPLDPVFALRNLADQIETGTYGKVLACSVVLRGQRLEVFYSGTDTPASEVSLELFNEGAAKLRRYLRSAK